MIFYHSSDVFLSLKEFGKHLIGILCLPLSFYIISGKKNIFRFSVVLGVIMILYMLNLIFANLLGWGNAYGGDSKYAIDAGASIVTGSMPIVIALMMAPFIYQIGFYRKLFIGIWSATLIAIMLIFKRTNIAALLIGYIVLIVIYKIYQKRYKVKTVSLVLKSKIKYILGFVILLSIFLFFFGTLILAQYEIRSRKFDSGALEKEGRVIEWYLTKEKILQSDKLSIFLFGTEPYNTPNNYGAETSRNIHGDFSMVLFSTGVVGFVFYWSMQIYIALLIFRYAKKKYLRSRFDLMLFSIYLAGSSIWFLFGFSGTMRYVLLSAVYYMIQGMILRHFWNKQKMQERIIKVIKNETPNSRKL